jgi:hypothetical protein
MPYSFHFLLVSSTRSISISISYSFHFPFYISKLNNTQTTVFPNHQVSSTGRQDANDSTDAEASTPSAPACWHSAPAFLHSAPCSACQDVNDEIVFLQRVSFRPDGIHPQRDGHCCMADQHRDPDKKETLGRGCKTLNHPR